MIPPVTRRFSHFVGVEEAERLGSNGERPAASQKSVMTEYTVNLILPHPPATNNLYYTRVLPPRWPNTQYRAIRGLTTEGQQYKALIADLSDGITPFVGDVWVVFRWFRPRRAGDLDGIFKIILDGLTGHAYSDDKQVARIHADRFEDAKHPRVELEIKALGLC
ncbi:hypothetical protein BH10ACI2_BH10ACI2_00130 [soil metagenome]